MAVNGLTRNLKFSDGLDVSSPTTDPVTGLVVDDLCYGQETDSTTTGTLQDIAPSKIVYRLTNASLESIDSIDPATTKVLVLVNHTGGDIDLVNDSGTALQQILTGTGDDLTIADEASVSLTYDETETKWLVTGGAGGAGGLKLVVVTSTPFSAVKGEHYLVMATTIGSDVVCNAQAVEDKAQFAISDGEKSFGTYSCSVYPNGSDTADGSSVYVMRDDRAAATFNADLANTNFVVDSNVVAGNGAVEGPWTTYTPAISGLGTVTSLNAEYKVSGENYYIRGSFVSGTVTASEARIPLPNGYTIKSPASQPVPLGRWNIDLATANSFHLLCTKDEAYVTVGAVFDNGTVKQLDSLLGTEVSGNSNIIGFSSGPIPINQLAGTGTTNLNADALTRSKTVDLSVTGVATISSHDIKGLVYEDSEGDTWLRAQGQMTLAVAATGIQFNIDGVTLFDHSESASIGYVVGSTTNDFLESGEMVAYGPSVSNRFRTIGFASTRAIMSVDIECRINGLPSDAFVGADSRFSTFAECLEKNPNVGVEEASTVKLGTIKKSHVIIATRSANLTLTTGANINFDQITSGYTLSGGGIVVPETGNYRISFTTDHNFGTITANSVFRVRVGGADVIPLISSYIDQLNHGTVSKCYSSSGIASLTAGDVVYLYSSFIGSINFTANGGLQMEMIR